MLVWDPWLERAGGTVKDVDAHLLVPFLGLSPSNSLSFIKMAAQTRKGKRSRNKNM
jgi:hypothetical protein